MTAALAALGNRYFFNRQTMAALADGLEDEDWARQPGDAGGNTAHWILGHLATSRRYLLRKLGEDLPEAEWEGHFGMNADPQSTDGYPSPADLLEDVKQSGKGITARLSEMSAGQADEDWGSAFPDGGKTIADGAHFLFFHEAYHVGQLGLIRRICGRPGIA